VLGLQESSKSGQQQVVATLSLDQIRDMNARVLYLEYLEAAGLTGLNQFMYTFISALVKRKNAKEQGKMD